VFTADVGSPVIWASRYLTMNGSGGCSGRSCTGRWPTRCRRRSARRHPTGRVR
jgi:hypothetical protein